MSIIDDRSVGTVEHVTYRQKYVSKIHECEYCMPDPGGIESIRSYQESAAQDVVSKHLNIVFPLGFQVQRQDALQPECHLHQIIKLEGGIEPNFWPILVKSTDVEPVGRVVEKILHQSVLRSGRRHCELTMPQDHEVNAQVRPQACSANRINGLVREIPWDLPRGV